MSQRAADVTRCGHDSAVGVPVEVSDPDPTTASIGRRIGLAVQRHCASIAAALEADRITHVVVSPPAVGSPVPENGPVDSVSLGRPFEQNGYWISSVATAHSRCWVAWMSLATPSVHVVGDAEALLSGHADVLVTPKAMPLADTAALAEALRDLEVESLPATIVFRHTIAVSRGCTSLWVGWTLERACGGGNACGVPPPPSPSADDGTLHRWRTLIQ